MRAGKLHNATVPDQMLQTYNEGMVPSRTVGCAGNKLRAADEGNVCLRYRADVTDMGKAVFLTRTTVRDAQVNTIYNIEILASKSHMNT